MREEVWHWTDLTDLTTLNDFIYPSDLVGGKSQHATQATALASSIFASSRVGAGRTCIIGGIENYDNSAVAGTTCVVTIVDTAGTAQYTDIFELADLKNRPFRPKILKPGLGIGVKVTDADATAKFKLVWRFA